MININLLPEEYRKKKTDFGEMFKKYKDLAIPGVAILGIVIVIVSFIIVVYPGLQGRTLRKLETRWKKVEKDYNKVVKLKKKQKRLQELLNNIKQITEGRILWARRLNDISDSLPSEIQLKELVTRVEKIKDKPDRVVLIISGIVPSFPGERAIGDFIKGLMGNPGFVKDFPVIEPPSTETQPDEFKKFTMPCYMVSEVKETRPSAREKRK